MLLYASDLFRQSGKDRIDLEENPDELVDLVAELLVHAVEERQRRHLSLGYRIRHAEMNRVRGRINILATERRQLLQRGLVACRFDELTIDTPRNRFVRAALETIARLVQEDKLKHRCRKLAADMKMMGVAGNPPAKYSVDSDRFGRHEADDQYMVAAAKLAFDLALPTELSGANPLALPDQEERCVRRLFERAVGGFYSIVLKDRWRVLPGLRLNWPIQERTSGIERILPTMQTDIVLDEKARDRRIVVDTKFTSILKRGQYREETLSSNYLYQMYAYLHSQVGRDDPREDQSEGLLLHPAIGERVDESAFIQGHRIRFSTVDLSASTSEIRRQLLQAIEPFAQPCKEEP